MSNIQNAKKLLIAPLDWGLGHTTRCIPIIRYLSQKNCQIWVAGNTLQIKLLKEEFPSLTFITLEGYNVSYPKKRSMFLLKMAMQVPQILLAIRREQHWLKVKVKEYGWNYIISDQRFGMFTPDANTAFITHQLNIQSGFSSAANRLLRHLNYKYIRRFNTCWIPDMKGSNSLAGKLSHPPEFPGNERYIGVLSRFRNSPTSASISLLVIISGPEPQRTIFEELIFGQLNSISGKIVVIRGLPGAPAPPFLGNHVTIHNHLASPSFEQYLSSASIVLCRAGYSGIMDLVALGKRGILVPTPGQTEQEYLAEHHRTSGQFYVVDQEKLFLPGDMEKAARLVPRKGAVDLEAYREAIDEFLSLPGKT